MIDILIVGAIFAYAAWTLYRHVKKKQKRCLRLLRLE